MHTRALLLACGLLLSAMAADASTTRAATAAAARPGIAPARAAVPRDSAQEEKPAPLKPSKLGAAEIVTRNVAARGGLEAWRGVKTLSLSGQVEAGGTQNSRLPFVMEMKRPHKSRLEIRFRDQIALQIYDGEQGWKVRPFLNRQEVEPFTAEEAKIAATWAELDGPLVDYAGKGYTVSVEGLEPVEGRDAYRLKVTMKGGTERRIWIDATTFLDAKIEGDPRKMDGKWRKVAVYYRDHQRTDGLVVPRVLETVVEGVAQPHRMTIERVAVNQALEDTQFAKPQVTVAAASGQ